MAERTWHLPAGSTGGQDWLVEITPAEAGWGFASLRVLELPEAGRRTFHTGEDEMVVLPLSGSCTVSCERRTFELRGRDSVFSRVSDFAYVPRDADVTVASERGGRFALPAARATRRLPPRYGAADDVPVELRGAGQCSRQVNNFCNPQAFDADKLIAVEVLTPAGNWSSFPPHKHDEQRPGEAELEEIYHFEVAEPAEGPAPGGAGRRGMAYQRVYGQPDRPIDVLAEVRSGDTVLIPHGWHGPSMAVPGYDLYYLNVMAGPADERVWRICEDPAHAWVKQTWTSQHVDPRLPLTSAEPRNVETGG